jgi:phosphoglycolate phosphatase
LTTPAGAGLRLVAIDLDGTLVDSAPDLNHCLGAALASVGLRRPGEDRTRSWIGDGVEELIRRALADAVPGTDPDSFSERDGARPADVETFRCAYASFSACYADNLFERSRLYPSVIETLDALLKCGLRLACITNKRIAFANGVLEKAGIFDRFELVLGGDSLPQKKPSPAQLDATRERFGVAASSAALVGDSHHDFHAAKAAGWRFVWARYGYCAAIHARREDAVAEIDEFAELAALLIPPR